MLVPRDWWGKHVGLVADRIVYIYMKDCSPAVDKCTGSNREGSSPE